MTRAAPPRLILVVEDEETLAESISFSLEAEGFDVAAAGEGFDAIRAVEDLDPDLVLLDLMLPGLPGLEVLKRVRERHSMPVIILTAKSGEADKVIGLELGADDYVTKPFSMRELISRVRAHLRRVRLDGDSTLVIGGGGVALDVDRHEVSVRGTAVDLRPKEFDLLYSLLARKGHLVMRETLISEVWGYDYVGDSRTLDVHVRRLREKIEEDPKKPALLRTVRGLGYKFVGE